MSIRPWAIMRRLQYAVGTALLLGVAGVSIFFLVYYVEPSCLDRSKNGDETGVDCGGGCVQICASDVLPPKIVWAQSFEITESQYNVVAYVENPNQTAGAPVLNYTMQLLSDGDVIGERKGRTVLPPNSVYPIFEGRVITNNNKPVTDTNLILEPAKLWLPASVTRDQFRSSDINLSGADDKPSLNVEMNNNTLNVVQDVEVVATIFNDSGEPITASQSFIERIEPKSSQNLVFTWPNPIAKTVRNCIVPTDVVLAIDLSGSMNNDGDNPPQPITKALQAAGQFISSLRERDQVAVVTFATAGKVVNQLTRQHNGVASTTVGLKIEPSEETGFTNTVSALSLSQAELDSTRHNPDARRVLVLLTDGLPTKDNDENVVEEATELAKRINDKGVEIYSIGLGKNVDQTFIKSIASNLENAYFAPDGEELGKIYSEITSSICEVGPTKIDVIVKTNANFAPIR